ncbi:MAG: hypothetical protein CMN32_04620 [Saprospirales bacterium]|nr:hypothetical protein [Saprospirales bacterium]
MKKAATYSLIVLTTVAAAGAFMRAMPWLQVDLSFEKIRHAHSHLGFLGWLFSAYILVLLRLFLPKEKAWSRDKQQLFYAALVTAVLMFPAFWLWGYKAPAIALLTLHSLLAWVLLVKIWRQASVPGKPSGWFLKAAIFFFFLSSLGPFAIPFIQVFGDGSPVSVRLAVHFYLHFQYSGWFVFGFLAMLYRFLEIQGGMIPHRVAAIHLGIAGAATAPLYILTAPALNDSLNSVYQHLSWLIDSAPWWQLAAMLLFLFFAWRQWPGKQVSTAWPGVFALSVLTIKVLLEWLVFLPPFSNFIDPGNHFLIITYLHLLFLGMATPAVWWMYGGFGWLPADRPAFGWWGSCFLTGFVITEGLLLAMGLGWATVWFTEGLLAGAVLMLAGVGGVLVLQMKPESEVLPQAKGMMNPIELPIAAGEKKYE